MRTSRERYHLFDLVARRPDGAVLWVAQLRNRLADEGEILQQRLVYRAEAVFGAALYGRLYNTIPVDASTLATLAAYEMPGAYGYAPLPWNRDTTDWSMPATLGSGESETMGIIQGWTADGGNIGPFTYLILATTADNSGKLFAYASFGGSRTIIDQSTLEIRPRARSRGVSV